MKNKKKILAAAGILVLAGVAAVCYIQNRDKKEAASIGIIGGADGPTKIFLAGKIGSHFPTMERNKSGCFGP